MKKLLVVFAAAMLACGFTGQAMAYSYGDLVQFIYEGTVDSSSLYEYNTGLGSVKTGDLSARTITAGQPALNLSDFATSDWDELYVGFTTQYSETWVNAGDPIYKKNTNKFVFMATTTPGVPNVDTGFFTTFSDAAAGLVNTVATPRTTKSSATGGSWVSYWEKIEAYPAGFNTQGAYAGFNHNDAAFGFASLGILDNDLLTGDDTGAPEIGQYIDLYLWQYLQYDPFTGDTEMGFVDINGEFASTYIATLRIGIQDDGTGAAQMYTQINPVPIPPSALLLASSLFGLFGIRRKRRP